jgi:hypothetical protein
VPAECKTGAQWTQAYEGVTLVDLKICPACKKRLQLTTVQAKAPRRAWVILARCPTRGCHFQCYLDDVTVPVKEKTS